MRNGAGSAVATSDRVGTTVLFENERVRVWDHVLDAGERGELHTHRNEYFWLVIEGGPGIPEDADGTTRSYDFAPGQVGYWRPSAADGDAWTHTLNNVGSSRLRFIVVEILADSTPPD